MLSNATEAQTEGTEMACGLPRGPFLPTHRRCRTEVQRRSRKADGTLRLLLAFTRAPEASCGAGAGGTNQRTGWVPDPGHSDPAQRWAAGALGGAARGCGNWRNEVGHWVVAGGSCVCVCVCVCAAGNASSGLENPMNVKTLRLLTDPQMYF